MGRSSGLTSTGSREYPYLMKGGIDSELTIRHPDNIKRFPQLAEIDTFRSEIILNLSAAYAAFNTMVGFYMCPYKHF